MQDVRAELIEILNRAMSAEYGALFLLPQHIAYVQDEATKRLLRLIADMELEHAEKTAQMILALGGEPTANLPLLQPSRNLRQILEMHLQGEREAIDIYALASAKCHEPAMRKILDQLKAEEEQHLNIITRALNRL